MKKLLVIGLTLIAFFSKAQDAAPRKVSYSQRVYGGFIFPQYQNNPDLTTGTTASFSFNLGYRRTYTFFGSSFDVGLEYINENLSFNSYYHADGYSPLFGAPFPFQHALNINEFQLPVLFRKSFGREDKKRAIPYITFGWALRYFVYSSTSITDTENGVQVYDGKTNITFEYPFFSYHLGALLQGALGLQLNNVRTKKGLFFELGYKLALSRFNYIGNNNSNELLIKDSNFTFNIGKKF